SGVAFGCGRLVQKPLSQIDSVQRFPSSAQSALVAQGAPKSPLPDVGNVHSTSPIAVIAAAAPAESKKRRIEAPEYPTADRGRGKNWSRVIAMPVRLHVNIDHVATIRNARGTSYPDPVFAAHLCEAAGADGITAHLREDRRHIRDDDLSRLRTSI